VLNFGIPCPEAPRNAWEFVEATRKGKRQKSTRSREVALNAAVAPPVYPTIATCQLIPTPKILGGPVLSLYRRRGISARYLLRFAGGERRCRCLLSTHSFALLCVRPPPPSSQFRGPFAIGIAGAAPELRAGFGAAPSACGGRDLKLSDCRFQIGQRPGRTDRVGSALSSVVAARRCGRWRVARCSLRRRRIVVPRPRSGGRAGRSPR
jgi:hypothetical protein